MELMKTPLGQIIKIIIILLIVSMALWFLTSKGAGFAQFVNEAIEAIKNG